MIERRVFGLLLFLALAIGIALIAFGGSDFIVQMGRFIPQDDLPGDYTLGVLWAALLGLGIMFWPVSARDRRLLLLGWFARSIMTLGFMLFYEYYYDTDSFWYYFASRDGFDFGDFSIGQGTNTVYGLARLHHALLPDSFHMMKVSFSMIGLIAVYVFYRAAVRLLKSDAPRLFYALALYPSILFWSSIVGKDPAILLGIAVYAYAVASWHQTGRLRFVALMALGVIETMFFRAWMGAILLTPLGVFALYRARSAVTKMAFIGVIAAGLYMTAGKGGDKFNIGGVGDVVTTVEKYRNAQSIGGSRQFIDVRFTSVGQVAAFTPFGMFTALFRPLPGEVLNPFGMLASLENMVLLILFLGAMRKLRWSKLKDPPVSWAGLLVLVWSAAYGFISYQNLGAAVRYKLQVLPIMLCLLLHLNKDSRSVRPAPAPVRHGAAA